jgi:hypothetical protein
MPAKRGRPTKGPYQGGRSKIFTLRLRDELRSRIEEEARANGRSNSQEVEHRLRRSFNEDLLISDRFGSRAAYAFVRFLSGILVQFERTSTREGSWIDDRVTALKFRDATVACLNAMMPPATEPESESDAAWREAEAIDRAGRGLLGLAQATPQLPVTPGNDMALIRSDLGAAADRILEHNRIAYTDGQAQIDLGGKK